METKDFLIFEGVHHSVVYFVRAVSVTEAVWKYIAERDAETVLQADGSLVADGIHYTHPLEYIETNCKVYGEWQIRELPEWTRQDSIAEVFCGESTDGPEAVALDCQKHFNVQFPKTRAKTFVWYLTTGTLVTFYQKKKSQIYVLKRYLWNWDGKTLTVEDWTGDYAKIADDLSLLPTRQE